MRDRQGQFEGEGGLQQIAKSYLKYGIHELGQGKYLYRQWAPGANKISIFGQFNGWNRDQYCCQKVSSPQLQKQFGIWQCQIDKPIVPFSRIKCQVQLSTGLIADRIPAWINYSIQNPDKSFDGAFIPKSSYNYQHPKPDWSHPSLRIYQCHIGMSGIEQKVHSFAHFQEQVLPRVHSLGYNVLQIMGVLQHPYYGSFGYHVSNFFAVSSRFGTPDELRSLIDAAHSLNIKVVIDLVHSHAAKNVDEGINIWDGTDYQYFHGGNRGNHPLWDSRVFDYSKYEVLRFLLANISYWLEQFHCDGFRFDGVTSMLYKHHGHNFTFSGDYRQYFNDNLDMDAIVYLMLANKLAKTIDKNVILIAEDVSGLPGLCRQLEDGGIGFNYRLAMAVPDMWIRLLKEVRDEDWDIQKIVHMLTNRRWKQHCIGYAESHDQALVGDKTLAMWLFDKQIYTNMSLLTNQTLGIFRGMCLHKMIRLITYSLAGESYLTFMGNEFGHPEWIDFPRQGNNWSYHYCRRRWDLPDNHDLRYRQLENFDRAMLALDHAGMLDDQSQYIRTKHNHDKIQVYERSSLLFVFNWHCTESYTEYAVYVKNCQSVRVILSTDDVEFGGHARVEHREYTTSPIDPFCCKFLLYIPNRCAIVLKINLNMSQE